MAATNEEDAFQRIALDEDITQEHHILENQEEDTSLVAPTNPSTAPPLPPPPSAGDLATEVKKELEQATAAAKEVSQKLLKEAHEAKDNISTFVNKLWTSLETGPSARLRQQQQFQQQLTDVATIRQLLDLTDPQENILESFHCKLLQVYKSFNNTFTPQRMIAFQGHLHVTTNHIAFLLDALTDVAPIKVPFKEGVVGFIRLPASTGLPSRLEVQMSGGDYGDSLIFSGFALGELEADSAAALIEQQFAANR
jgi:hypothetical protein